MLAKTPAEASAENSAEDKGAKGQAPQQSPQQSPTQSPFQGSAKLQNLTGFRNPSGVSRTLSRGDIDLNGPFFTEFGTNGRTCASCHVPSDGFTITPAALQQRFAATGGTDPVFRTNDGSVSPNADVSTLEAKRQAYAMLLSKGLIRIGLPIPANAEFSLAAVDDPYKFASAKELSLFRRPLPSTNLRFHTTIMWDGRETTEDRCLVIELKNQANDATTGHAQGQPLPDAVQVAIVKFELGLFTAQTYDNAAGDLTREVFGGPVALSRQRFAPGLNDPRPGASPAFNPNVFNLFQNWAGTRNTAAQTQIARGERLFNARVFNVAGVRGLNNPNAPVIPATCSSCHNAPNAGTSSIGSLMDIGLSDGGPRRTPDMPLYTLRNNATGETVQTTDPGRALITGKWADLNTFKVPSLRGLASRAPFFHNGGVPTLAGVVGFYNDRFQIGLSPSEAQDLEAFLRSL